MGLSLASTAQSLAGLEGPAISMIGAVAEVAVPVFVAEAIEKFAIAPAEMAPVAAAPAPAPEVQAPKQQFVM